MNKQELKRLIGGTLILAIAVLGYGLMNRATISSPLAATAFEIDFYSDHTSTTLPYMQTMITARYGHAAVKLNDGRVLVIGGRGIHNNPLNQAEIYNPLHNSWTAVPNMSILRGSPAAALLQDGRVLVVDNYYQSTWSPEIYNPATNSWSTVPEPTTEGNSATLTMLKNGHVLLIGNRSGVHEKVHDIYNPATNSWTTTSQSNFKQTFHTATLLPDGRVLVTAGGSQSSSTSSKDAELYNPANDTWTIIADMHSTRWQNPAVLLNNGTVLQISGEYNVADAETYSPATSTWTLTGDMLQARLHHEATLLPNGDVLTTGGGQDHAQSVEKYVATTNSWVADTPLSSNRAEHTATLLDNGRVLIVGGRDGSFQAYNSAELYGQGSPILVISNATGKAGSFFTVWGYGYTPNQTATILVNGRNLGTATIDNTGFFNFQFNTSGASNGAYIVTVQTSTSQRGVLSAAAVDEQATTTFHIDAADPNTWPQAAGITTVQIPANSAFTEFRYFPIIGKE